MNNLIPFYKYILSIVQESEQPFIQKEYFPSMIKLIVRDSKEILDEKIYERTKGVFIIDSPFCSYELYGEKSLIYAYYNNIENLRSTIWNLPGSVVANYNGDILLHCSGIVVDNAIILFCAPKGTGKSTMVASLLNSYSFYSDDTVYFSIDNNDIITYAPQNSVLKLNRDVFDYFSITNTIDFDTCEKTIQNKAYVSVSKLCHDFQINKDMRKYRIIIISLHRMDNSEIEVTKVNSSLTKKSILIQNIAGISYFSRSMVKKVLEGELLDRIICDIDFYYLNMPNNLAVIKNNAASIVQRIMVQ